MFSNLFTYARSRDVDQLENFTTEAFAASIRVDPKPFADVLVRHGVGVGAHPNPAFLVATQEVVPGVGIIDLIVRAIHGSDIEAEVWVEVKVWASESGDQ